MVMRNDSLLSCLECWYYGNDGCLNHEVKPGETCYTNEEPITEE